MPWIVYSLISLITDATATLTQRVLMKGDKSDPVAYMIVFQFLTAALIGFYVFATNTFQIPSTIPFQNILLSAVLVAIASLYLFKALNTIEASELAILGTTGVFWNSITAAIFLGEAITPTRILGTLLIIVSVIIVSWRKQQSFKVSKGSLYALISAAAFGLAFTNDAYIMQSFDVMSYLLFGFLLPGLIILLVKPSAVRNMKPLLSSNIAKKMILFCILYGIQAITIFKAYQAGGDSSQIYPIAKTYVILVVILGAVFLNERNNLPRKLLAALTAFAGVIIIR